MKKTTTLFLSTFLSLLAILSNAQTNKKPDNGEFDMNFVRAYGFSDIVSQKAPPLTDKHGLGFGVAGGYGGYYGNSDEDGMKKPFKLGWCINSQFGFGKLKTKEGYDGGKWFPYGIDIGFIGRYRFNQNIELGFHYSFLGLYSYSQYACFGAGASLRLRVSRFQFEYGREGGGLVRGAFNPKDNMQTIHSFGLLYLTKFNITGFMRYTTFNMAERGSGAKNLMHELRIGIGWFVHSYNSK